MKLKHILPLLLLNINFCVAQNLKLMDLHGVWVSSMKNTSYVVFVKDTLINLGFTNLSDIYISYTKVGFIDVNNASLNEYYKKRYNYDDSEKIRLINHEVPESLGIKILNSQKNENDYFYYGGTLCGLGIDPEDLPSKVGSRFELINSNVFVYIKVAQLPNIYINALYRKGIKDKKDYLRNILDISFKEIKSAKSIIYTSPNIPTKMYLVKGNEVEIIEKKDNWLKIRYYGKKTIEGWVKKEDVE